jgi:hypothetical protein
MREIEVRIVKLEPMRVASVWGFGQEPEGITYNKLDVWREDSKYKWGHTQWLEENIPSDSPGIEFVLDLYLPIAE